MITFVEFLELCESSTGESGRRRVSSRGPSTNRSDRNKHGKTHNTKTSKRTGVTVNRIREWIDILEVNRPESGTDKEKAAWDRQKARRDALENSSSKIIGQTGRDKEGNRKYGLKDAELRRQQGKRRSKNLKPLTTRELEDHAKRNLYPTPTKTAKKAIRI